MRINIVYPSAKTRYLRMAGRYPELAGLAQNIAGIQEIGDLNRYIRNNWNVGEGLPQYIINIQQGAGADEASFITERLAEGAIGAGLTPHMSTILSGIVMDYMARGLGMAEIRDRMAEFIRANRGLANNAVGHFAGSISTTAASIAHSMFSALGEEALTAITTRYPQMAAPIATIQNGAAALNTAAVVGSMLNGATDPRYQRAGHNLLRMTRLGTQALAALGTLGISVAGLNTLYAAITEKGFSEAMWEAFDHLRNQNFTGIENMTPDERREHFKKMAISSLESSKLGDEIADRARGYYDAAHGYGASIPFNLMGTKGNAVGRFTELEKFPSDMYDVGSDFMSAQSDIAKKLASGLYSAGAAGVGYAYGSLPTYNFKSAETQAEGEEVPPAYSAGWTQWVRDYTAGRVEEPTPKTSENPYTELHNQNLGALREAYEDARRKGEESRLEDKFNVLKGAIFDDKGNVNATIEKEIFKTLRAILYREMSLVKLSRASAVSFAPRHMWQQSATPTHKTPIILTQVSII